MIGKCYHCNKLYYIPTSTAPSAPDLFCSNTCEEGDEDDRDYLWEDY